MRLIAIMPCRNSAWVLGLSARALLMFCDELHVLCHACTDTTEEILLQLGNEYWPRITKITIKSGIWQEMAHRQLLLESARANGATHIVTVDDDEILSANLLPKIRQWVENVPPGAILQLPWLQLRGSIDRVITSGLWAEQNASAAFRDDLAWHWRARNGYDHHHRHPMGKPFVTWCPLSPGNRTGGLMHFQMASNKRLLWKHLHYKLTERLRWPENSIVALNAMYDRTVIECNAAKTTPIPESWWAPYAHLMQYLDIEAEPWQGAEAKRLLAEHPKLAEGLTTYGLEL